VIRRLLDWFDRDGQWRALQAAQRAIDANQEREIAAGVDQETAEYLRLHEKFYAIWDRLPWWKRWTW
jgi:hypothetical protein